MFDLIGKRNWYFTVTGIILVACIIFWAVFGLKSGVEFSSGSVLTVGFGEPVQRQDVQQRLSDLGYNEVIIQETGSGDLLIRLPHLTSTEKTTLQNNLTETFPSMTVREFDDVSEMVAKETTTNAGIAVAVATVGILLYMAWAFRKMSHPFHYGVCAIVALVHDALVSIGIFALMGKIFGWEIDLQFVIGILAVIGYSVNNTVVVFDRVRENQLRNVRSSFVTVVNNSLIETMTRSINTSLTTLFVVVALIFFVGTAIQNFAVIMLIGIIAGTYSSMFIAPSLLVAWQTGWRKIRQEA